MVIVCRTMNEGDIEPIRDLICRTIDTSYRSAYSPQARAFFKEYHSARNIGLDAAAGKTLVALQDGAVVGTGSLVSGEIKRVFVDPPHQGQGVGRIIMDQLIEQGRIEHLERVSLDASSVSREIYGHWGFRFVRDGRHELGNGLVLDYSVMVLDL